MGMEFLNDFGVPSSKPFDTPNAGGICEREIAMTRLGFLTVVLGQFDILDSLVFGQRRNAHLSPPHLKAYNILKP